MTALIRIYTGLLSALVLVGCFVQAPEVDKDLNLLTAVRTGDNKRVKELLAAGASANGAKDDRLGLTIPLVEAVTNGHVETAKILIAAGADVNKISGLGNTALVVASHLGDAESVKLLLGSGANPNIVTKDGWGPLQIAARDGYTEIVRLLLARGAARDHKLPDGNTALTWARVRRHQEIEAILKQGLRDPP